MSRILALDYGLKRVGLAVTDPLKIIATPLATIESPRIFDYLKAYLAKEPIECIVIGDPLDLQGKPSEMSQEVAKFAKKLAKFFPQQKIILQDERLTSKMASQSLLQAGIKKKKRQSKGALDKISATLILQEFLAHAPN